MQGAIQGFQVSPQQKRLWSFHKQLGWWRASCAIAIEGMVDRAKLQAACQQVIDRYEIFRTAFQQFRAEDPPLQILSEGSNADRQRHSHFSWQEWDLSSLENAQQHIDAFLQAASQPSPIETRNAFFEFVLVRWGQRQWKLLLRCPALWSDRQTFEQLAYEIGCLYEDRRPAVEPLQYADIAQWQNELLAEENQSGSHRNWERTKQAAAEPLPLPFLFAPEGDRNTFSPEWIETFLDGNTVQNIEAISQEKACSFEAFLLAAWYVWLWRLSYAIGGDHRDGHRRAIVVGVACDIREAYEELQSAPGILTQYLPASCSLQPSDRFTDLLTQVATSLEATRDLQETFDWQQYGGSETAAPLASTGFEYLRCGKYGEHLQWTVERQYVRTDQFSFQLTCLHQGNCCTMQWHYNAHVANREDIQHLAECFHELLASAARSPQTIISELNLLGTSTREQLVKEFNNTETTPPPYGCVHHWFAAQVSQYRDRVAVLCGQKTLTYAELDERANQLAWVLQKQGVEPETLVGLFVNRSPLAAIAIFGILKAGGAYVPLDPSYPQARTAAILEDSCPAVVVTQSTLQQQLPETSSTVVLLDSDFLTQESIQPPPSHVGTEHLAYVMYTSGSTGQPKGTLIPHRSLVNYLAWCVRAYDIAAGTGSLVHSSLAFDLTITGLFSPLLVGQSVELIPEEEGIDALAEAFCRRENLSLVKITPAALQLLAQTIPAKAAAHRTRTFVIGGENLLAESLAFWQLHAPQTQLVNEYGPTETVVGCCTYRVAPEEQRSGSIPIGKPIDNVQLYVLDRYMQPVPVGIPGELYIGGAGLARGYLHRTDVTAEKFVPHPFSQDPQERLYKTGDLVRHSREGHLEFLGRIDRQVKLRGFRIELPDIESTLASHEQVQEVVVELWHAVEDQRLVAYAVLQPEASLTSKQLRDFAQQRLPEYMVPAAIVFLDALPLTPNGKVDRQALPSPHQAFIREEDGDVRMPVEEMLCAIWEEILGTSGVGVRDHFFDLGGHSLLATQVVSRIQEVFGVSLPLRELFQAPTVAELASCVETKLSAQPDSEVPSIEPQQQGTYVPLSFPQQRLWCVQQLEPDNTAYNMPAAIRLQGDLDVAALHESLQAIVDRHQVLRTGFTTMEGEPVQVLHRHATCLVNIVDLSHLDERQRETEVERLQLELAHRPFDLAQPPLLRLALVSISHQEWVLVVVIHHIVADGWSVGLLIRELSTLYAAFSCGLPSPLPALPIQYADFARWQRQWLQREVLDAKLAYWKRQLSGAPTMLPLPLSSGSERATQAWPAPPASNRSDHQTFVIDKNLLENLQALSRRENVTLFMTLLAAFQTLLYRYTQQEDIVVGTDVANRNRAQTEGLIGFFVNLLALRGSLQGNPSFQELLQRTREMALQAYAHQDVPFEKIANALNRDLERAPLFHVLFVLQNAPSSSLQMPGLTVEPIAVENRHARFDLALFLTETQEGMVGKWKFKADLYDKEAIARLSQQYVALLQDIVERPQARIDSLNILSSEQKQKQTMHKQQKQKRKASKLQKFANVQPKTTVVQQESLVSTQPLYPDRHFPLLVQPTTEHFQPYEWAQANRTFLEQQLSQYGAILFRNFGLGSAKDFQQFAEAICPNLFADYGDLPRQGVTDKVYGATPYPADEMILFHNESSHMPYWPQKIWFFCEQPASEGGETPIVDCRQILQKLDRPLRQRFRQKQLNYVRNYTDGLDVSWQEFFQTENREDVETFCQQNGIEATWKPDGGLRTSQVCPAIIQHPHTGEWSFFNQIQLHHANYLKSQVRESLLSLFGEDNLPRNVYYGDGTPIDDATTQYILDLYQTHKVSFPWQQGDVLMLDNMLTAHGRHPYSGARKIVVALGNMIRSTQIQT